MNNMATLTVFTPAYNRAHTLERTYQSLCAQTSKDFVWLIVDDGSSDGTQKLVQAWQQRENGFDIEYIYKENGGMHTAHNTAYAHIHTELNTCVDSDDWMPETAIEDIVAFWAENKKERYAGIIALDTTQEGRIIGCGFSDGESEISFNEYFSKEGRGDKKLIYRTDVVKAFSAYPVFEGEKYFGLDWLYRKIDQKYPLLVLNKPVCIVDYQADGSTATMYKQYTQNPKGFALYRKEIMESPRTPKELIKSTIHYVSSSIFSKEKKYILHSPRKVLTVLLLPCGYMLNWYIKWKNK